VPLWNIEVMPEENAARRGGNAGQLKQTIKISYPSLISAKETPANIFFKQQQSRK
jgi:hypothetical protein